MFGMVALENIPIQLAPDSSTITRRFGKSPNTPNWKSEVKAWRTASGAVTLRKNE